MGHFYGNRERERRRLIDIEGRDIEREGKRERQRKSEKESRREEGKERKID